MWECKKFSVGIWLCGKVWEIRKSGKIRLLCNEKVKKCYFNGGFFKDRGVLW